MNRNLTKAYAVKLTAERRSLDPKAKAVSTIEAESEIVRITQKVARTLAPTFKFGYHSVEDMEQQGIIEALEVLETDKYDISRPLENFLYVHIHNSLYNYKRKHYKRLEPPCSCCDAENPPAYPCQKFSDWQARNSAKQNLMRPLDMSNVSDESETRLRNESVVEDDTIASELRSLLDRELAVDLRRDYLQMLDGKLLPRLRREKVREAVLEITRKRGYFDGYEEASDSEVN